MTKTIDDYKQRTIEALMETNDDILKTTDCAEKRKGRLHSPLLHISLDNFIPDELHLLLRVTDILTRNLIYGAANQDRKDGRVSKDITNGPMVKQLIESVRSCGVSFKIQNADKKAFTFTSLVGGDKLKLLKKLPDKMIYCQPADIADTVKKLWQVCAACKMYIIIMCLYCIVCQDFYELHQEIKSKKPSADSVQDKVNYCIVIKSLVSSYPKVANKKSEQKKSVLKEV